MAKWIGLDAQMGGNIWQNEVRREIRMKGKKEKEIQKEGKQRQKITERKKRILF